MIFWIQSQATPGLYTGSPLSAGHSGSINSGMISFEIEYGLWVQLQEKKNCQLRNVLQAQISKKELRVHVDGGLAHFRDLFRMKAEAAKADVFHVMHGMYRSPVERFFLWIGGFRPSEIIQVVVVSGETGCGKTTQLPQYILESEVEDARGEASSIICT